MDYWKFVGMARSHVSVFLKCRSQPGEEALVYVLPLCNKWYAGFRARLFRDGDGDKAIQATIKPTPWLAVRALFCDGGRWTALGRKLCDGEFARLEQKFAYSFLNKVVLEVMGGDKAIGSQPDEEEQARLSLFKQPVRWIHQIYGVYRDSKPLSDMFQENSKAWREHAQKAGADYHLWNADELDTLARQLLPSEGLEIYKDVRFPIMRVDMGRFLILYVYGGLYSDLDVQPNRDLYRQCAFAVGRVRRREPVQGWDLEMEMVSGAAGNPIFLEIVKHQLKEIASRSYDDGFWRMAKMRYVYHTTGPKAMQRFLQMPRQAALLGSLVYWELNRPDQFEGMTAYRKRRYDGVSRFSLSYATAEHEIKTELAPDDVVLRAQTPVKRRRLRLKQVGDVQPLALSHTLPLSQALAPLAPIAESERGGLCALGEEFENPKKSMKGAKSVWLPSDTPPRPPSPPPFRLLQVYSCSCDCFHRCSLSGGHFCSLLLNPKSVSAP